ncbi:GNAT family N-acetyltransferase [Streptacidiphilus sp. P02-A3a]|uniref:GNAT family N-acetyltransferase n=1 Tax=Streptacidiphilus sp. P02-A3a TaxID=2704468 RepID=UPI0015FC5BE3|nr:GNAT family N-acetyltransferase [Streptacidiphilus sp. P02-A3a]QMU70981.1 GNAT family N-acetyltransferase [Streptacidiphilus sp. P02-A3a]
MENVDEPTDGARTAPDLLAEFDRRVRRGARPDGAGAVVELVDGVLRQTAPAPGWNAVLWSDLDRAGADAAIAAQVAHYTALGRDFEWKLYAHDRPADLGARLLAAGFTAEPEEALMIAPVAEQLTGALPPEGVTLRPVTGPAEAQLLADVHEQAFGSSGRRIRDQLLAQLARSPETVHAVLAMAGERPVSAARLELVPGTGFAGLWGGGTVEEWRGRGVYRALIAHRARIAADRGYRYLQVDASADSRPILARLGFTRAGSTTPYQYRV